MTGISVKLIELELDDKVTQQEAWFGFIETDRLWLINE